MNSSKTVSDVLNLSEKFRVLQNNTEIPVYEGADFDFAHMVITDFPKSLLFQRKLYQTSIYVLLAATNHSSKLTTTL